MEETHACGGTRAVGVGATVVVHEALVATSGLRGSVEAVVSERHNGE